MRYFLTLLFGLLLLPQTAWAQDLDAMHIHAIEGRVVDAATGEGIVLATVAIVGTKLGAAADEDGRFSFRVPMGQYTLRVSAIGYQTRLVPLEVHMNEDVLTIELNASVIAIDEVLVQAEGGLSDDPAAPRNVNATEDLLGRVAGADFIQRGNFAWEPVVRGLGGGQIGLVIDGMKVIGACVDKMDPTSAYVEVENLEKLELTKGGFDLTQASQIGGTVNLITEKPRFDDAFYANGEFGYGSAAALRRGRIVAGAAYGKTSIRGSYSYKIADDFAAGSGTSVFNSGYQKNNYKFDVARKLSPSHQLTASFLADNAWDIGYPVLLMDATLAQAKMYSLTHTWEPQHHHAGHEHSPGSFRSRVAQWETRVYHNTVDHWMDDYSREVLERPVMRGMNMPMYGSTRTSGGISTLGLAFGARTLGLTLDVYQTRSFGDMYMFSVFENIRDMYLLNLGDVVVQHGALAVDFSTPLTKKLRGRFNARLDVSPRDVERQEAIAILEGRWQTDDLATTYTLPSVSATFEYNVRPTTRYRLALAHVARLPTHVENYGHYVYNYVDGYFYTGNPNLKAERSSQVELGAEHWAERIGLKASVYANYIENYIVGQNDSGLLSASSTLRFRVYRNASAALLLGGEVSGVVQVIDNLELAASASYARGQNLEFEEPMFLIPPLSGLVSLRYSQPKWWGELEGRMAMPQNRVARLVADEDGTDGYFVLNARGSIDLGTRFDLRLGVENVFDTLYHQHLSFGNLPSLGRNVYAALAFGL